MDEIEKAIAEAQAKLKLQLPKVIKLFVLQNKWSYQVAKVTSEYHSSTQSALVITTVLMEGY
jgi:hypothetical protein